MAYFYQASRLLFKFSGIVGDNCEKNTLEAKCIDLRNDFNKLFFDPAKASYGKGSQSEISVALAFGLVPDKKIEAVIQNLLLEIERCDGHLDTGIQGTRFLLISLAKYGYIDKALAVLKKQGFPGFQWWLSHGATTLWERWNGTASLNHAVYSYISEFFYSAVAGIIPMDGEREYGWRKIYLRPGLNTGIRKLDCSCNSLLGPVKVAWVKKGNQYQLRGSLPDGCSAILRIPQGSNAEVRQHGQRIESIKLEKDLRGLYYGLFELTSGNFCSYITL
jgi:alpha-L-rhamnosidase